MNFAKHLRTHFLQSTSGHLFEEVEGDLLVRVTVTIPDKIANFIIIKNSGVLEKVLYHTCFTIFI